MVNVIMIMQRCYRINGETSGYREDRDPRVPKCNKSSVKRRESKR